jgi:hypothetical protein
MRVGDFGWAALKRQGRGGWTKMRPARDSLAARSIQEAAFHAVHCEGRLGRIAARRRGSVQ